MEYFYQIDGGKCGDPHKLDKETLEAYRKDENCLKCHWREIKDCSAKYLYQPPNLFYPQENELECDPGLVFVKAKGTCAPCQDAKTSDGKSCCKGGGGGGGEGQGHHTTTKPNQSSARPPPPPPEPAEPSEPESE